MAFAAVCAVMVFFLFGTAQLSNQKTRLQNTADAAAYSAGVLQARDYNFSAYTNRAIVANHVAMAQFVGLESWTDEITKEFKADTCLPYLSKCWFAQMAVLQPMWTVPERLAYAAANVSRNAFNAEKHLAPAIELLIKGLQTAQTAYHLSTMGQFAAGTPDAVAKANDPDVSVTRASFYTAVVATEIANWNNYTKKMTTQAQFKRFANVTVDSMGKDGFSNARNMVRVTPSIPFSFIKPLYCPLAEFTQLTMGMAHGGGTQLSSDMSRWFALDSAGVSGDWLCVWYVPPFEVIVIGSPITSIYMDTKARGGGVAGRTSGYAWNGYSTSNTSSWGYGQFGGALTDPVTAPAGLIQYASGPGSAHNVASGYDGVYRNGLRTYNDVSAYTTTPTNQVAPANIAPPLSIEVAKNADKIRTADQILPGNDKLKLNTQLKGGVMKAVATSQAYFLRPHATDHQRLLNASEYRRDGDNKTEYASLFNPYWQARLVETPRVNVELSTAAQ